MYNMRTKTKILYQLSVFLSTAIEKKLALLLTESYTYLNVLVRANEKKVAKIATKKTKGGKIIL